MDIVGSDYDLIERKCFLLSHINAGVYSGRGFQSRRD